MSRASRALKASTQMALVVADNVNMADAKPYVRRVRTSGAFLSSALFGGATELSYYSGL